jgi:hypothetical protein
MKAFNFISSLLPTFQKGRIEEDNDNTLAELVTSTIPAYKTAAEVFKGVKFKSATLQSDFTTFSRNVPNASRVNMIVAIESSFKDVVENLKEVRKLIDATYGQEIAGAGLTYLKANLLQFQECVAFFSKYSRKYLRYVYVLETAEYPETDTALSDSIAPYEVEWLRANFINFCMAFNVVTGNPSKIKTALKDIPEIVITSENNQTLPETVGNDKIDPFKMGFIPIWMNPIYHVRIAVAEWQAARYKAAKEELNELQLRHLYMQKAMEGKNDAKLRQQIQYMETRITNQNKAIHEMEVKYA